MAGEPITAVADKWSIPTYLPDLVEWVSSLVSTDASGVLHACHSGEPASWHDVATCIAGELQACGALDQWPDVIRQSQSQAPALNVERPCHSAMSNARLESWLPQQIRPWPEALAEYVRQVGMPD